MCEDLCISRACYYIYYISYFQRDKRYHGLRLRLLLPPDGSLPLSPPLPQLQDVEQVVHRLQLQSAALIRLSGDETEGRRRRRRRRRRKEKREKSSVCEACELTTLVSVFVWKQQLVQVLELHFINSSFALKTKVKTLKTDCRSNHIYIR